MNSGGKCLVILQGPHYLLQLHLVKQVTIHEHLHVVILLLVILLSCSFHVCLWIIVELIIYCMSQGHMLLARHRASIRLPSRQLMQNVGKMPQLNNKQQAALTSRLSCSSHSLLPALCSQCSVLCFAMVGASIFSPWQRFVVQYGLSLASRSASLNHSCNAKLINMKR